MCTMDEGCSGYYRAFANECEGNDLIGNDHANKC